MDTLRWISVVVSMILGMGVTRLLGSGVDMFKARRATRIDWLAAAWAALIFLQMATFWWSLEDLAAVPGRWEFHEFLTLIGLVLLLYVSAALALPQAPVRADHFGDDGRFALLSLSLFNLAAAGANVLLWGDAPLWPQLALNLAAAATPFAAFFLPRVGQAIAATLYAALLGAGLALLTPASY